MNKLAFSAALIGFSSVALGAFGAHGLGDRLSAEALEWWNTATFYALVHAVAALAIARLGTKDKAAGWAFIFGVVVFAGSLYAMALGAPRMLGAITPIGGVSFLAGWGWLALCALRT